MKKNKIFAILIALIFPIHVSASTCTTEELNELEAKAKLVTAYYETESVKYEEGELIAPESYTKEEQEEFYSQDHYYNIMNILVVNVSSDFQIETYNNVNGTKLKFIGTGEEIKYRHYELWEVTTVTVDIYTSENTNCSGEFLTKVTIELPRYNYASNYEICDQFKDESICSEYTFSDELTNIEFNEEIEILKDKLDIDDGEETFFDKIVDFIKNNAIYFVLSLLVIVVLVVVYIKWQNKRGELNEKNDN